MTAFDRDDLIRLALAPADTLRAPADLADDIERAVAVTPQRRPLVPWFAVARWMPSPSPATALAAILGLLVLLGVLIAVASRRDAVPPGLTTYHGGPARTGIQPGPGPTGHPEIMWTGDLHGTVPVMTMPIVQGDRVYVADGGGFVTAFDAATGAVVMDREIGESIESPPTIAGDTLVVAERGGRVSALALGDFGIRWQATPGGEVEASLLAVDGAVYVGSDDGTLYVLDASTGATTDRFVIGSPITRGPAYADGALYVATSDGSIRAIDAATGATRWVRTDFAPGAIGTPTVVGDTLFIGRGLGTAAGPFQALALDIATGDSRWTFSSPAGAETLVGAVADGTVYLVSKDGFVYALDAATGAEHWRYDTDGPMGAVAGYVDGVLYLTNDAREVRAHDAATGDERWVVDVPGMPTAAAVIDGRVFVATNLGKVVALADPH